LIFFIQNTRKNHGGYRVIHRPLEQFPRLGTRQQSAFLDRIQNRRAYTIQGWTMDVERLKRGGNLTDEFFERQLEIIRENTASGRSSP
jgi:hypothetical protein